MTVLQRLYASGGDAVLIPTIELTCSAWDAPLRICHGFDDVTATDENGVSKLYRAGAIEVALPKRDTSGTQVLVFAIDNVTGSAQRLIDQALEAAARMQLVFRQYVSTDLSAPADRALRFEVRDVTMEGSVVQVSAAFFDLINTAWPRNYYTADFAPGLKYFQR